MVYRLHIKACISELKASSYLPIPLGDAYQLLPQ
jgi:hypothetical protein